MHNSALKNKKLYQITNLFLKRRKKKRFYLCALFIQMCIAHMHKCKLTLDLLANLNTHVCQQKRQYLDLIIEL